MSLRRRPSSVDNREKNQSKALTAGSADSGPKLFPASNKSDSRFFIILAGILLLCVYAYLPSKPWTALSDSYVLCSRDGNKIYTVDENNSQTECIVVHGSYIVDTGALRKSWTNSTCRRCPTFLTLPQRTFGSVGIVYPYKVPARPLCRYGTSQRGP